MKISYLKNSYQLQYKAKEKNSSGADERSPDDELTCKASLTAKSLGHRNAGNGDRGGKEGYECGKMRAVECAYKISESEKECRNDDIPCKSAEDDLAPKLTNLDELELSAEADKGKRRCNSGKIGKRFIYRRHAFYGKMYGGI